MELLVAILALHLVVGIVLLVVVLYICRMAITSGIITGNTCITFGSRHCITSLLVYGN